MTHEGLAATVIAFGAVAVAGVAVDVVTRRAASGRLRLNRYAGLRLPATLASPEAWRAGHAAAVPYLRPTAVPAVGLAAAGVVAALLAGPDAVWPVGLSLAGTAVLLVGLALGAVAAHRAAVQAGPGPG